MSNEISALVQCVKIPLTPGFRQEQRTTKYCQKPLKRLLNLFPLFTRLKPGVNVTSDFH